MYFYQLRDDINQGFLCFLCLIKPNYEKQKSTLLSENPKGSFFETRYVGILCKQVNKFCQNWIP